MQNLPDRGVSTRDACFRLLPPPVYVSTAPIGGSCVAAIASAEYIVLPQKKINAKKASSKTGTKRPRKGAEVVEVSDSDT